MEINTFQIKKIIEIYETKMCFTEITKVDKLLNWSFDKLIRKKYIRHKLPMPEMRKVTSLKIIKDIKITKGNIIKNIIFMNLQLQWNRQISWETQTTNTHQIEIDNWKGLHNLQKLEFSPQRQLCVKIVTLENSTKQLRKEKKNCK